MAFCPLCERDATLWQSVRAASLPFLQLSFDGRVVKASGYSSLVGWSANVSAKSHPSHTCQYGCRCDIPPGISTYVDLASPSENWWHAGQ